MKGIVIREKLIYLFECYIKKIENNESLFFGIQKNEYQITRTDDWFIISICNSNMSFTFYLSNVNNDKDNLFNAFIDFINNYSDFNFADISQIDIDIYFNETFCKYFDDIDILYVENFSVV